MAILKNTNVSDTGFIQLPVGTTAQRLSPQSAQMRYNSTTGKVEFYNSTIANWVDVAYLDVVATGGNSIYEVDADGTTYRIHVFTTVGNSTFTVTKGGRIEYLIVGGGGGGSGNFYDDGAGGGAGGVVTGFTTVTPQAYTITVGGGGAGQEGAGGFGGNSVAFGLTALGGGGGASHRSSAPGGGGSGGGGGGSFLNDGLNVAGGPAAQPGSASGGFGNAGGNGGINNTLQGGGYPASGGGGGAGSPGMWPAGGTGGQGGVGLGFNITGTNNFYAGGGGGLPSGPGGIGGGALAQTGRGGTQALPATPGTGGGGGGGRTTSGETGSSAGGSGIVVVRYPIRQKQLSTGLRRIRDTSLKANFDFSAPNSYPGTGDRVYDSEFNGTSGVLVNSPQVRHFKTHRNSFSFNGSNQHIRLENYESRPSAGVTYEAWCLSRRAPSTGTVRGAAISNSASSYLGIIDSTDGGTNHSLHWALQTSGSRTGGLNGSIPRNTWVHLVGTYDGSRTKGYINGTLVYDVAQTGTVNDGTYYFGTYGQGINDGTHNWDGEIADAKIYNRGLTEQEVQNNFSINRWRFGI